ncbi:MAG: GH92 family glycosyl hydrolase [Clostridia bacterium]|nr:GH92 family glycosyl hydrolase [Clostridia bacterium]
MKRLDFVNALMGSYNEPRFSNGNIYPVIARPFAMVNFTVQTSGTSNWFYNPKSRCVEGVRLTHQPSPWVGDYGHLLITPFTGELSSDPGMRWSSYRPEQAVVRPDLLKLYMQRYRINVLVTSTQRGGYFFIKGEDKSVGIAFATFGNSQFAAEGNAVTGWTDSQSIWGFDGLREYFYIQFDSNVQRVRELENGGIAVYFNEKSVEMKMSTSFISVKQAELNYKRELDGKDFESVRLLSETEWEGLLSSIDVTSEDEKKLHIFYTCLYRTFLYPRIFYEYDETGMPVHYNADTKTCEKGVFYTDNGFWDTYRTVYPLLSIVRPKLVAEMVEGFINYGEETGWLPKWISPGEIGIMPGALVEAVIADACVKGIISDDLRSRAYKLLKKNAFEAGEGRHGRNEIAEYIKYGYIPNCYRESVNNTCDCAYGDFCVSVVAEMEGDHATAKELLARSKSYAKLFDPQTKFLRSRDKQGNVKKTFDPFEWGGDNCEGSSWQNSFAVYHDVDGLISLYGSKKALEARLDELFSAAPIFEVGQYGQEIHEMSEMACVDFGQMAISNQPSFHIPWLYVLCGRRDKASFWVERLAKEAFFCDIEGFPGDEDNGTTSAWYIFACLGFYPICPGKNEYVATKPLFDSIRINGRDVRVDLPDVVGIEELFRN